MCRSRPPALSVSESPLEKTDAQILYVRGRIVKLPFIISGAAQPRPTACVYYVTFALPLNRFPSDYYTANENSNKS
jgi:hypothetical protein